MCPVLKVHGTVMETVTEDLYLGDVISGDGKNKKNIEKRISKGLGIISQIMNLLEVICFGHYYIEIALLLRESMFINGILNNSEVWYGLTKSDISEFEDLDRLLLRRILKAPISTPQEALYLELGLIPIGIIIQAKRIKFLHYLLSRKETEMIHQFFTAQWFNPSRGDWTETVKLDLEEFDIPVNLEEIKAKSKYTFKKEVKERAKELSMSILMKKKEGHIKMENVEYGNLKIQSYFSLEGITVREVQDTFRFRIRMARLGENFRGQGGIVWCPLCNKHLDIRATMFECQVLGDKVDLKCNDKNIYSENVNIHEARAVSKILNTRNKMVEAQETKRGKY